KEIAPNISHVAMIYNPDNPAAAFYGRAFKDVAGSLAIEPVIAHIHGLASLSRHDALVLSLGGGNETARVHFRRRLGLTETALSLVQASTLSEGDYNVYDGERVIGRIKLYPQRDRPWFWIITASDRVPTLSDLGYAPSREQAMADFKARWKIKSTGV